VARPPRIRRIDSPPRFQSFKPVGVPRRGLARIELTVDEYEAIRLVDYMDFDHAGAAEHMGVSRPTFTRIVDRARRKVAEALVEGELLTIRGGAFDFVTTRHRCRTCGEEERRAGAAEPDPCPDCGSEDVEDVSERYRSEEEGWRR